MTRLLVLLLLIVAAASCQAIIDLGDEPPLAPGCGITRAPGPRCAKCLESSCCAESLACAADPMCKETTESCFAKCFDATCYLPCLEQAGPALSAYFFCAADCVDECTPTEDCLTLSQCCADHTGEQVEASCIKNARSENQELCRVSLGSLMCGAAGAPDQ